MPIMPDGFNGGVFAAKYSLNNSQFWADKNNLICPSLPNLTEADIADCITDPVPLIEDAVQEHIDATARAHGYASMERLCGWAQSTNLTWQAEALTAIEWRDLCFESTYEIINRGAPYPTPAEVVALLPPMVWP